MKFSEQAILNLDQLSNKRAEKKNERKGINRNAKGRKKRN